MKEAITITLAFLAISISSHCQTPINLCADCGNNEHWFDFNSPGDSAFYYIRIDTLQANNIWQIGTVSKNLFQGGIYGPRALVTDTINPYPANNFSSFQFSVINCSTGSACFADYYGFGLSIPMRMESDSSLDGGTIEVSHQGGPFINIIEDPTIEFFYNDYLLIYDTVASLNKPGFSGTSYGWQDIWFRSGPSTYGDFDTIVFRFTFASDNVQTNKDGWMIGALYTKGWFVAMRDHNMDDFVSIYPNPCQWHFEVKVNEGFAGGTIEVYSEWGTLVRSRHMAVQSETVDVADLPNGIYIVKYICDRNIVAKKVVLMNK